MPFLTSHLAKPTPLLAPLVSRRIRVETTWPKGCSIPSSSCSSTDSGRFEMYKFVGSCSCCYGNRSEKMDFGSLNPLSPSAVTHKVTFQKRERRKGWLSRESQQPSGTFVPLLRGMRDLLSPGRRPQRATASSAARAREAGHGRSSGLSL